jgi:transcriptional regulator with XRE-family HTH domain
MSLAERFREVREGLNLSQADFAASLGVSRVQLGRYERGDGMPGAEVLARLAEMGLDVLYVLTGRRAVPPKPGRRPLLLAQCVDAINAGLSQQGIVLGDEHRGRAYFGLYDLALGMGGLSDQLVQSTLMLLPRDGAVGK